MLGYLKVLVNPDDDVAFVRAIGTHPRGIGKATIDKALFFAAGNRMNLYEAAKQAQMIESLNRSAQGKLVKFAAMLDQLKGDTDGAVAPLMEKVFSETGMQEHLQKQGTDGETAIENIGELINSAGQYDKQMAEPNLTDYLQTIALYSDTDAYDAHSSKVSLMTLHAAKGLEFDNVFIVGLEDGLLPHERGLGNDEELEEERRLFFVGITRARKNLCVSFARHRVIHGQFLRTTPSQFLYEAGLEVAQPEIIAPVASRSSGLTMDYSDSQTQQEAPFRPNELVEHRKFGLGRVKEFIGMGDDSIVVVEFNSGKIKSLMLKYAKLKKVNIQS
jgi:DNA helicase-2/ATP-dependent DNA helicase PcrA